MFGRGGEEEGQLFFASSYLLEVGLRSSRTKGEEGMRPRVHSALENDRFKRGKREERYNVFPSCSER